MTVRHIAEVKRFMSCVAVCSVANHWQQFSARSTEKFGRCVKKFFPDNKLSEEGKLIFLKG
jgi:hypothetical protein